MRHIRVLELIAATLLATLPSSLGFSQTKATAPPATKAAAAQSGSDADIAAIRDASVAFISAFDKRDAKAVAAFWSKDGEYIDELGQKTVGRDEIEKVYSEIFQAMPVAKLQLMIDSIRLLSDSAAIEDGRALVEPAPAGASGISTYTVVHVKVGGKWLMASVRDTGSDSSPASKDLADLDWLIGDWNAEENGVRTESKCRWIANNKFVERSYTTTQVDGTSAFGLQIIGWNPQAGHVQSWNFSADGGHAIGVWSATEAGWLAKVSGTTGENISTTAVNTLKRLDDNAYVWQSMDRTIGDVRLPDSGEVVIRRKPATR